MHYDIGTVVMLLNTLAQLPAVDSWLKVVAQSGFNAGLVVLLIWLGNKEREATAREREKNRRSIDLNTVATSELTLALNFLPKQFHENAAHRIEVIKNEGNSP